MGLKIGFIFAIVLLGQLAYGKPKETGSILLNYFSCDTVGSKTQAVAGSLKQLKDAVSAIDEKDTECKSVAAQVAALPDVDSIVSSFQNNQIEMEIKEQEHVINEALADLAMLQNLPPDQMGLYPSPESLRASVSEARSRLLRLRASLGVQGTVQASARYARGIEQLGELGSRMTSILENNNSCFERAPAVKGQMVGSLMGIAGFFLQSPAGLATTLAAKLMQNVISMVTAKNKKRVDDTFEAAEQAQLMLGLSCALENLGKQHCRLSREQELNKTLSKTTTCTSCDTEIQEAMIFTREQKEALSALNRVNQWSSSSSGSSDPAKKEALSRAQNAFSSFISNAKTKLAGLENELRVINGVSARADKQRDQLMEEYGVFSDLGHAMGDGSDTVRSYVTEEEYNGSFLSFILDDPGSAPQFAADLAREYDQLQMTMMALQGRGRLLAYPLMKALKQTGYSQLPPRMKELYDLSGKEGLYKVIDARLKSYEKTVASRTSIDVSNEQMGALLTEFYGDGISANNPYQSLVRIDKALQALPKDFVDKNNGLLDITSLKNKVAVALQTAKDIEDDGFKDADLKKKLLSDTLSFVGPNNESVTQISTIYDRLRNYYITESSKSSQDAGMLGQVIFQLNRDIVEDAARLSTNEVLKSADYDSAKTLSAAQLESFGKYFNNYLDPAISFLQGQSSSGAAHSDGMKESLTPNMKGHFCIQMLNLTEVPQKVKDFCKSAKITSPQGNLLFSDYVGLGHSERVCAYSNYLNKTKIKQGN